jgi:hypothetical protein
MVPPVPRILGPVRKAIQNLDSCPIAGALTGHIADNLLAARWAWASKLIHRVSAIAISSRRLA